MADNEVPNQILDDAETSIIWSLPERMPAARPEAAPDRMPEIWLRPPVTPDYTSPAQVRDAPYVLRGRDHELAWMAQRISSLPRPVQLIQGPPGAGKTSLLHTIGHYAAAQGFRVVELRHGVFESHTALTRALESPRHPNDRMPNSTTVTRGEHTGAGVSSSGIGAESQTARTHSHDESAAWQTAIAREARREGQRGLILLLDEVQLLGRHLLGRDGDTRKANLIHDFLQHMHNAPVFAGQNLRTMLICAGLPSANQTLIDYELTRVEGEDVLGLGPIADRDAAQIIQDHMDAITPSGEHLPGLPDGATDRLAAMGRGYAHHISHAAQKAQSQAMTALAAGRSQLSDDDVAQIIERVEEAKQLHYEGRVQMAGHDERLAEGAMAIAQATEAWGEQLPKKETSELALGFEKRIGMEPRTLIRDLTAKGVLEPRGSGVPFPTAVTPKVGEDQAVDYHYVFPIPSMRSWLLNMLTKQDRNGKIRAQNNELITVAGGPIPEAERIPAWGWAQDRELPSLPPMPADQPWRESEKPAIETGNAGQNGVGHAPGDSVIDTLGTVTGAAKQAVKTAREAESDSWLGRIVRWLGDLRQRVTRIWGKFIQPGETGGTVPDRPTETAKVVAQETPKIMPAAIVSERSGPAITSDGQKMKPDDDGGSNGQE